MPSGARGIIYNMCATHTALNQVSSSRPSWDEYFLEMARLARSRSTCLSRQVGAVIVVNRQVIATGYNGSPPGMPHCCDEGVGCLIVEGRCIHTTHAEQNALIQAARRGVSTDGAEIYTTHRPCVTCANLLAGAGIIRVVYANGAVDGRVHEVLEGTGIVCEQLRLKESGEGEWV